MTLSTGSRSPAVTRYLADVRDHFGAAESAVHFVGDDGSEPVLVASSREGVMPSERLESRLAALVKWAADENMTHLKTASEKNNLSFGAARIAVGDYGTTVLTVTAECPLALPESDGRRWLERHARNLASLLDLLRQRDEFERGSMQTRSLLALAQVLHTSRTLDSLGAAVCGAGMEITSASRSAIVRWDADTEEGSVVFSSPRDFLAVGIPVGSGDSCGEACIGDIALIRESPPPGRRGLSAVGNGDRAQSIAIIPIKRASEVMGAIVFESDFRGAVQSSDVRTLRLLAHLAAGGLETVWELANLTAKAERDALTGLRNRATFDRLLRRELGEAERAGGGEGEGAEFSVLLLDIDHFKRVNDTLGHQAGDAVLVAVSGTLVQAIRARDICARYGGEEFAVILPGAGGEAALELAERVRASVSATEIALSGERINVTVSIGVATFPGSGRTRTALVGAADAALYRAKKGGRDRVEA